MADDLSGNLLFDLVLLGRFGFNLRLGCLLLGLVTFSGGDLFFLLDGGVRDNSCCLLLSVYSEFGVLFLGR